MENLNSNAVEGGVFINGREQIIEMLQIMNPDERKRLLNNIKSKNAVLAKELIQQSITFEHITYLSDFQIQLLCKYVQAPIIGIALKNCSEDFQRRILKVLPRDYAQEAFSLMMTPLDNERVDSRRAQKKILDTLVMLSKRNQVTL